MIRSWATAFACALAAMAPTAAAAAAGGTAAQRADDGRLSRAELRELQALLAARGHCEVAVDGLDGPRTRAAVREEQAQFGWPQTGRAGSELLQKLRGSEGKTSVGCTSGVPPSAAVFTTSQPAPGASLPPPAPAAPPVAPPPAPAVMTQPPAIAASGILVRPHTPASPASGPGPVGMPQPAAPPSMAPATGAASAPS